MQVSHKEFLFAKFHGNSPIDSLQVREFEEQTGLELPSDYVSFLRQFDGGEGFIGSDAYAMFWRLGELDEMNRAYQVDDYAPGFLLFGSDGGGEAFAFDTRTKTMPIVSIPFVGMDVDSARVVASTFDDFLLKLSELR
jgi:hypothetical protein